MYIMGDQTTAKSMFLKLCGESPKSIRECRDVFWDALEGSRKLSIGGLHPARWL